MRFTEFKIKNFKGIEDLTFNLNKSPEANIYTLIGLNESGKTTILEAIDLFSPSDVGLSALHPESEKKKDYHSFIPINSRDNFNDTISIIVTLKIEPEDLKAINRFVESETEFVRVKSRDTLTYFRDYVYENSKFKELDSQWNGFQGIRKGQDDDSAKYESIKGEDNYKLAEFCRGLIPSILYFPNFLFDFPSRIYLQSNTKFTPAEAFYEALIQDILYSLGNDSNIKVHLIDRIMSDDRNNRKNLESLIKKMERKVSDTIFGAWSKVFKKSIKDAKVKITYDVDGENQPFLEFQIDSEDGVYLLSERSLGFKWFFIFLLFTQFRSFRQDSPKSIIYLFDEPASNLHPLAQRQLLESFENLTENSKVIYTTHSHHLINPAWLESTYIVKNNGFHLDNPEAFNIKKTNIVIEAYRDFATNHPHNTAYFQPILDVLEYSPSSLENIPDCVFLEGKNDFYTISYFNEIILGKRKLNFAPSTGSGNLDTLISLYLGWGKSFLLLLDSDKAGKREKDRYIDKFGPILNDRVFLLSDIQSAWSKKALEGIFENGDALKFQMETYPMTTEYNKTHFNRSIQESLMNRVYFDFCDETCKNFDSILDFLTQRMGS